MLSKLRLLIQTLSKKERVALYAALVIFFITGAALGSSLYFRFTTEVPDYGGEYIEGLVGQPTIINPVLLAGNDVDRDLSELLFSGLLDLSEDLKHSDDGRLWTLALKKDLKWSDGEPLTSDDVVYTLDVIQDINTRSPLIETWRGVVAERISEREVKFTLKTPYAFFADNLRELKIIPQHIFGNIPNNNLRLSNFNLEPVGSGPYAYKRYEKRKDGFITDYYLDGNPYYAGTAPYITKFRVSFLPGGSAAIERFNTLLLSGFGGLDERELEKILAGYNSYKISLPRYYAVFFNMGTHQALKDAEVRSALALTANRDSVIEAALAGQATSVYGPILPGLEGYDAAIYANEKFSPEEARAKLEAAKWLPGEDGVREKTFGKLKTRLEFELVVPQIPFLIAAANTLKDDWAKIGVKVVVLSVNPSEINDAAIKTRNYHMILFGNILKNNPDVFAFWHSSERFFPGLNLAIYDNKKVDALLESIRRDQKTETRLENIKKLQALILADHPAIFLFSPTYLYVTTKNLGGFDNAHLTTTSGRFANVNKWYLKTKRVFK